MRKIFAMAALLAATAFTPALAQDAATAAEPTPIPERVMVQMAQREGREERREARGGGERPQWNGNRGGGENNGGGWQRREAQPAPQAPQQAAPAAQPAPQRNWDGGNRAGWQGRGQGQAQPNEQQRAEWQQRRAQGGWQRQTPPVTATPQAQPQQGWQGRNDGWRNRDNGGANVGGVQTQPRPDGQRWNGTRNDGRGWNGQRNDTWRNNDRRNDNRNDGWRNDGRNGGWNGNNGRNDSWRGNRGGVDLRGQYQNQYRGWNRSWSNDWRRDRRYDWQSYRTYNRNLFRADRYYAPYGWNYGYQRFGIGFTLSYLLFDQQYWIDDPYDYRLPPAYGPYRWVRYYDDVLLVDLRTGRVVDAIHDFFYDDNY